MILEFVNIPIILYFDKQPLLAVKWLQSVRLSPRFIEGVVKQLISRNLIHPSFTESRDSGGGSGEFPPANALFEEISFLLSWKTNNR